MLAVSALGIPQPSTGATRLARAAAAVPDLLGRCLTPDILLADLVRDTCERWTRAALAC